jgi:hypothetical protein
LTHIVFRNRLTLRIKPLIDHFRDEMITPRDPELNIYDALTRIFAVRVDLLIGFIFAVSISMFSMPSLSQTAAKKPAAAATTARSLKCTAPAAKDPSSPAPLNGQKDPFVGPLADPSPPAKLQPINEATQKAIFGLGLPCQEDVNTIGQEKSGLANLQRGFDFYSWRTFLALNSPADGTPIEQGQADTPTRWENVANFRQLLDVMLPPDASPPIWGTRLVPDECRVQQPHLLNRLIVQMIEESFNEPFKTGPLIDQQGHYAIFDILMNREMFDYIMKHHLNTKAGQMRADNSDLLVDFPVGDNSKDTLGAFMLKVSWKILSPEEIQAKKFHMVDALVLMPKPAKKDVTRLCLPEKLGLVGFHAVHKTASRPQWIWTSFEHVQNVPASDEDPHKGGPYNFFSVNCKGDCTENATPPTPWDPDPALELRFRKDDSFKSQIVRKTPLTPAAKNMNMIFQSMLSNSVWKNYMLISTQWPSLFSCTSQPSRNSNTPDPNTDFVKQPDMTCSPAPTFLANSTLETYSQGDTPLASSSCIACHSNAVDFQNGASNSQPGIGPNPRPVTPKLNQSDFTYMLEKAQ